MINMINMIKNDAKMPFLGIIVCACVFCSAVHAGDKVIIKPIIDTAYMVETNFYKTETNERSVSSLTLSPGLEFVYNTAKSKVSAIASFNVTAYDDFSSVPEGMAASNENDYIGYKIGLSADTELFTRVAAGLDASRINTRSPSEREKFNDSVDVDKYSINRIRPWLMYNISDRLASGLEARHTAIEYSADSKEDSSQLGGKASLYYELSKFTTVGLEYAVWKQDYDLNSSDYTSMEYRASFSSKFKYFGFAGGAGFHEREFGQAGLDDIDVVSWDISIKGQNPPQLATGEKARSYIDLSFSQNFNDIATGEEYYRADRISLTLGHLFMEKLDARIDSYFQRSDYERDPAARKDDTYFLSGSVGYPVREWLTLTLKAGVESRNSSVSGNDYDNAFVLSQLTFNHHLGSK